MRKFIARGLFVVFLALFAVIANGQDSENFVENQQYLPIRGVELRDLRGWLANTYSRWGYIPEPSTVHPVPALWTPFLAQSPEQIRYQSIQLQNYGSSADVILFNPAGGRGEVDYWRNIYIPNSLNRPFFVLYEHVNQGSGSKYVPDIGPKNMNLEQNRRAFREDIDLIFKELVLPYWYRYVVVDGRAMVYLWSSVQMTGNLGSLLDEARNKYPIFFFGAGEDLGNFDRVKDLDGIMQYTLGGLSSDYLYTIESYNSTVWYVVNVVFRNIENMTGKKLIFIPTFQFAYDDTKIPDRRNPPLYARNREEVEFHAAMIKQNLSEEAPVVFVVYSEWFEGGAVGESQCLPETFDSEDRFVGCGFARLELLREFFYGR